MQITSDKPTLYRWDDLRVLLALSRRGSLKAAAQVLGVNISTVSRRLDALEAAIGKRLFDRTPDGTRATAALEKLLPHAERMERAALELSTTLDGFEVEPEGLVRITAPPGLVDHFLAGIVGEIVVRFPELTIELDSSIGYSDLTRREADIALRTSRPRSGDLLATKVASSRSTIVCSSRRRKGPVSELDEVRWVTYEDNLSHLPDYQWIARHAGAGAIALKTNSLTAQIQAVRAGGGATLLPAQFLTLPHLAALPLTKKLQRRLAPLPEGSLWLVGHEALRDVPRVKVVWDYLAKRLRTAGASG